ncbi:hypothetical protein [Chamaesiphon sp. GL140_3_metabinner_50]|uniref:hypothetical protein n=1 Tax=Chamaesiphon sp. GL140_3_metabinner_50 TaxID=2970812 RepID=UPI0025FD768E|nr:hypothetical protein [Chamaesiphon sp. GL140_3_metabinner_50]
MTIYRCCNVVLLLSVSTITAVGCCAIDRSLDYRSMLMILGWFCGTLMVKGLDRDDVRWRSLSS